MYKDIELGLLKVIHELVVSGSATQTARSMGLSPGTISYKLKKARGITGAHLFIRTRSGMKPDAVAVELSHRYQKLIEPHEQKNPDQNTLTISAQSPIEIMLSDVHEEMFQNDPPMRLNFVLSSNDTAERINLLKNGQIDLDIGSRLSGDSAIGQIKVFSSGFMALASRDADYPSDQLTLEEWNQGNHIGWPDQIDYYCHDIEKSVSVRQYIDKRNISVMSASIVNMAAFCASSDCLMLVPSYYTRALTETFPLKTLNLPQEIAIGHDCYLNFNRTMMDGEALISAVSGIINCLKMTNTANTHY